MIASSSPGYLAMDAGMQVAMVIGMGVGRGTLRLGSLFGRRR